MNAPAKDFKTAMPPSRFFLQLSLLSLFTAALIVASLQWPPLQEHGILSWGTMLLFMSLSVGVYYLGSRAAHSTNKHQFTNVVVGFTMLKMMLCILIILAYNQLASPTSKWFALPFLGIYLFYTIFETYVLMRLGRLESS
jgi:hypothetical protein